jgi:hypothetical protein
MIKNEYDPTDRSDQERLAAEDRAFANKLANRSPPNEVETRGD